MRASDSTKMIQVKILDDRAKVPERGTPLSAAYDIIACIDEPIVIRRGAGAVMIPTGLAMFIGEDFFYGMNNRVQLACMLLPRSGLAHKKGLILGNTAGLVDCDYQGQWMVSAWNRGQEYEITIHPGDRLAQAIFIPVVHPQFLVVEEFSSSTDRGEGGFGSTGGSQ